MKAIVDDIVIADSYNTIFIEGNHYFPPESIRKEVFEDSATSTTCPWKGQAKYYHAILPNGTTKQDVAWYYPEPKDAAKEIKGYVAFYKSKVKIE